MIKRWVQAGAVVLALAAAAPVPPARADDARFDIKSAYTVLRNGVYYLNANMSLVLNSEAASALNSGVPLVLKINIELTRRRSLMWDATVAELAQSYRVTYHALSRRYVVQNMNSGRKTSYRSWRAAFAHLGELAGVPVIDASLLDPEEHYDISIRAVLNVKIIPTGFGLLTSIFYGGDESSDWYEWALR